MTSADVTKYEISFNNDQQSCEVNIRSALGNTEEAHRNTIF